MSDPAQRVQWTHGNGSTHALTATGAARDVARRRERCTVRRAAPGTVPPTTVCARSMRRRGPDAQSDRHAPVDDQCVGAAPTQRRRSALHTVRL
uniref:DUF1534 domain-containing protein n=1 Tax=Angiostrongylus cantonensis TaxID=6313 RepID=A0A0K0CYY2_ANGCA